MFFGNGKLARNPLRAVPRPSRGRAAIALAAVHAVEHLENRLLFTTYLGAAATSQSTTPLGINVGLQTWYNSDALFYDVRKDMDGWRQPSSPYSYLPSSELTPTGYPLEASYTETAMVGYPQGTYTLVYSSTGNANITPASMGSIVPDTTTTVTVNGVTTTTVQILVQDDTNNQRLLLYANNVDASDQISNLHLYMPGYTAGEAPPELNPNVASRLGPFGTIRLMDLLDTNDSTVADWSDRTTPEDFSYTSTSGIAYEDAIAISNQLQENLWWNIPVQATPDYMTDLAELIKFGSDGVNPYTGPTGSGGSNPVPATGPVYPGLDSNLKVNIEFGNELWHEGFPDDTYNIDAGFNNPNIPGSSLPNANPSWFSAANNGGEFAFSAEQDVYELRQTYSAFACVYGSALSSQISFVLAADTSTSIFSQAAFTYLEDMSSQWGAPSSWISAYAVPTYINVDSSVDVQGMTLNALFSDLDNQITTTFASTITADVQFANSYGLPLYSYEGGQGLIPDNENATVKDEAQVDPRMGQFYTELLNEWYSLGGSLVLPFDFADTNTSSGDWGLLQTASDPGSPKWDAVIQRLVPLGDANLDGVVDGNDVANLESNYGFSKDIYWQQGDFNGDGIVNAADFTLLEQNASPAVAQQAQEFIATTPQPQLLPETNETNIIGTSGSYEGGGVDTITNVFDGDLSTFFDAPSAGQGLSGGVPDPSTNDEVGLDLGSQYSITAIRFAPRAGFEQRMIGGVFLASNNANFSSYVTLYTITAAPSDALTTENVSAPGTYCYLMYVAPANGYGNVSELQFYGLPALNGTPSITPAATDENIQTASALTITASDPNTVAYQITGITDGTLYQNDGVTPITNGSFITVAQATAGLKFTPATNLNSSGSTTFSFSAQASSTDSSDGLSGGIATGNITVNSPPVWLDSSSVATWNSSTETLTVTGPTTITADPAATGDLPNIIETGASAYLSVAPTSATTTAIHIAGLALSGGAGLYFAPQGGSANSEILYSTPDVLIVGTPGSGVAQSLSIDSTSTIDLTNNDMILTGTSDFSTVQSAITSAYHNGAWNLPGILSSAAAGSSTFGVGYDTGANYLTANGSAAPFDGQSVSSGETLVKYTLLGDATLTGSVGLADYNIVLANYNTGTTWAQGAVHPGQNTGLADYNAVLANYNQGPTGELVTSNLVTSNFVSGNLVTSSVVTGSVVTGAVATGNLVTGSVVSTPSLSPATTPAAPGLTLDVNTATGDVSLLATAAIALTRYNIADPSGSLLDSGHANGGHNELLLSTSASRGGNRTTFRSSTNYANWSTFQDDGHGLSQGQNLGDFKKGKSGRYDTIFLAAGQSIDLGDIFNTTAGVKDLTLQYAVANPITGDPLSGSTYKNAAVDYIQPTPLGAPKSPNHRPTAAHPAIAQIPPPTSDHKPSEPSAAIR
jgi:hypothetical protein